MKKVLSAGAALLLTTTAVSALGLDRSGQNIGIIFEEGSYAEFSFGNIMPSVEGNDVAPFGTSGTGNIAEDYSIFGFGYKRDVNDQLSFALIADQPYGADVSYAVGESVALGGTAAVLDSNAITGILRYKMDENISFHGGLRAQTTEANITLAGAAYGPLSGYNVVLDSHTGYGYTIGAAYEVPAIALRVALTYTSEIEHAFKTTESIPAALQGPLALDPLVVSSADTKVTTPQAVNLDFQTGIAEDTLLFGSVRWAEYSKVIVNPENFPGSSITNIDDGFAYNIGIGRRLTDQFAASVSIGYDPAGDSDLVSPLSATNGNYSVAVGGEYSIDNISISGGVRYIVLGDASASTSDTERAAFSDNSAIAVGFKVGFNF